MRMLWGPGLVLGWLAFGCTQVEPSTKQPLVVCTAGENGCPSDKSAKDAKRVTSGPVDGPTEVPAPAPKETPQETPAPTTQDAGAPEPTEAPLGAICTKLKACCAELEAAGYSTTTCLDIVSTKSENACSLQHKQYLDFGDCSPPQE